MHIRLRAEELEGSTWRPTPASAAGAEAGSVRNRNVLSDFISA